MKFLLEISENGFTKLNPVPARMSMEQVSALLGVSRTGVSYLCLKGELDVLGSPKRNQEKFFCADDVLEKVRDKRWLARITNHLYKHHESRNRERH